MTRPVLAAFCLAFAMPLAAQQTMPPAPFAYRQLEDLSLIHISEPTRLLSISYAVFCLKKKKCLV